MPFSGCLGMEDGEASLSHLSLIQIQEVVLSGGVTVQSPLPHNNSLDKRGGPLAKDALVKSVQID